MYNKALDIFKAVADCGSFTKATELLYISHTAIIKQINGLEAHFGVKLFYRSNHGAALTPAGQCLYEKTLKIMCISQKNINEIQAAHFASQKTIRVGTSLFYPCYTFMDLWNSIGERYPMYQLKIVPIEDDEHRYNGLNDSYDFLVGPYNSEVGGSVYPFVPIGQYHFCLTMPQKHALARKKSLSFRDLTGESLMIIRRGVSEINDRIRDTIEHDYSSINLIDIPPHYNIHTFNRCVETGYILLSLECWNRIHPGLVTIPLMEDYALPYGILTAKNPDEEVTEFIHTLQKCLHS